MYGILSIQSQINKKNSLMKIHLKYYGLWATLKLIPIDFQIKLAIIIVFIIYKNVSKKEIEYC